MNTVAYFKLGLITPQGWEFWAQQYDGESLAVTRCWRVY
jgi:hypothetical protein